MIKNILLIILLSCISSYSYAKPKIPTYPEIVNTFFEIYDLDDNKKYYFYRFVKKQEGYYIEDYNEETREYHNAQLFWSMESGEYVEVKYEKGVKPETEKIAEFLNEWKADKYDMYPVYGYISWPKDAINHFESKKKLSPDELYALGRSYSHHASNLINNNSGFADTSEMFSIAEYGYNQLSPDDLTKYRHYRHKAIEAFGKLADSNPDYNTIVGSISNKYHNEYLTSFLDIRIYHSEEEAMKELPDSLYSPFYMKMAENYLKSCDTNAILFTNGDNDTFQLLYLQAKKNYRTDVLIVNMALLNNNNYINHLRYDYVPGSGSLKMVLDPDNYSGNKLAFTIAMQNANKYGYVEFSDALDLIKNESPITENKNYPDYRYLVSDGIKISIDSLRIIEFRLKKEYLIKGELIALDIASSNISERPVYFAYNKDLGLTNNMELNGFAYKLTDSTNAIDKYPITGGINASRTFHQLIYDFNTGNATEPDPTTKAIILNTYQRSFCHLAKHYADAGEKDSCRMVIEKYLEEIPDSDYKMDFFITPMVSAAYKTDLIEVGDLITANIIANMNEKLGSEELSEKDIMAIRYTIAEIKSITKTPELLQRAVEVENKVMLRY